MIANWNWAIFSRGDFKVTALILFIVPFMLLLPEDQTWINPRDLAGVYILMASFDINFAIRDLLKNRNLAAMITWTEVVFYNSLDFLKVSKYIDNHEQSEHDKFQLQILNVPLCFDLQT